MSDFFAAYLFMGIGLILLICAFIFKANWLCFFSALGWLFAGIYAVSNYDATRPFALYLGIFFIFVALGMGIMPFTLFKRPKDALLNKDDPSNWENDEWKD